MVATSRLVSMSAGSCFIPVPWVVLLHSAGLTSFRSPGEGEPLVEGGSATFAAATWLDAKEISRTLDDIAQADIFICDETRTPTPVWLGLSLRSVLMHRLFMSHGHLTHSMEPHSAGNRLRRATALATSPLRAGALGRRRWRYCAATF